MQKIIMISQPMAGLTDAEIIAIRNKAIKEVEKMGYEYRNTFFDKSLSKHYKDPSVRMLGETINEMANCDAVYFVEGWWRARLLCRASSCGALWP